MERGPLPGNLQGSSFLAPGQAIPAGSCVTAELSPRPLQLLASSYTCGAVSPGVLEQGDEYLGE